MKISDIEAYAASSRPHAWMLREALSKDYIDRAITVTDSGTYYARHFEDMRKRLECYFNESLITALIHPERVIAFRAFTQASSYFSRLIALPNAHPGASYADAYGVAKNRIEQWLEPCHHSIKLASGKRVFAYRKPDLSLELSPNDLTPAERDEWTTYFLRGSQS